MRPNHRELQDLCVDYPPPYKDACDLLIRVYEYSFGFRAALAGQKYDRVYQHFLLRNEAIPFADFVLLLRKLYPDEDDAISAGVVACASLYEANPRRSYGVVLGLNDRRVRLVS